MLVHCGPSTITAAYPTPSQHPFGTFPAWACSLCNQSPSFRIWVAMVFQHSSAPCCTHLHSSPSTLGLQPMASSPTNFCSWIYHQAKLLVLHSQLHLASSLTRASLRFMRPADSCSPAHIHGPKAATFGPQAWLASYAGYVTRLQHPVFTGMPSLSTRKSRTFLSSSSWQDACCLAQAWSCTFRPLRSWAA